MASTVTLQTRTAGNEFMMARIIGAPRASVFKAWTDPERLAQWFGPRGFTVPVCQVDLRPGGAYRIVMRSPEGIEYPLKGVYLEVIEPERLVCTSNWEEHPAEWQDMLNKLRQESAGRHAQECLWTVSFEERDGKTNLTILTTFESAADRDAMLRMEMAEGWAESLERLDEHLAQA